MDRMPFRNVEELKENAKLLCRALAYYGIRLPESSDDIGLQRTQELIARSFRCVGWKDLMRRVESQNSATYLDEGRDHRIAHLALAECVQQVIGGDVAVARLHAAFSAAAVGCTARARNEARRFFSRCGLQTAEQRGRLMQVEAVYSYHSRYNNRRTAFEIRMLEYGRQKAVAEILGTRAPRKPRRRKGE